METVITSHITICYSCDLSPHILAVKKLNIARKKANYCSIFDQNSSNHMIFLRKTVLSLVILYRF